MKNTMFRGSKSLSRITALLIVAISIALGATGALAQDDSQQVKLSIKPVGASGSYFDLTMPPGETQLLAVELGNHGTAPIQARTYAADAYTINNGGFGARLDGEPATGTTLWVSYPADTLDLDPGMAEVRSFTVTVPSEAQPGEYITSIVIQNAVPTGGDGEGVVLKQVIRQVVAIAINVPGDSVPALAIDDATYKDVASSSVIAFSVRNPGDLLLKPVAEMVVFNESGAEIDRKSLQMGSFYAGSSTNVEFAFAERLEAGTYTASLTLTDAASGAAATTTEPLSLSVPKAEVKIILPAPDAQTTAPVATTATEASQPWALVAIAVIATLAVVSAIAGGIVLFSRRKARPRAEQVLPAVTPAAAVPAPVPAPASAPMATTPAAPVSIRKLVPPGHS